MKKTNLLYYEAPIVEVVEVDVEQGFSVSDNAPNFDDPFYFGFESEEEWS
jgi:hypothetical protein